MVAQLAARLNTAITVPLSLAEVTIRVGVSIGVALFPAHGEDAESLLQHADVAMYESKRTGAEYALYQQEHDRNDPQRFAVLS